ncbi:MAG: UvrD-helicase domain-containing protein [Gammaproteobacteria bacterium]|nr:UvrD-helicase domain-containing protein [Gammaproteobacteria bacterium]
MNLKDLNPPQQQAVTCVDKPCLVLAGAGSGKTGVITRKIAWLIHKGHAAGHIYAVTFTNKAAREMRQRVNRLLDRKTTRGLSISTFHSLGQRILLRESYRLGYRRGFSIMDARDVENCLDGLAHRIDLETDYIRQAMYQISRWKNDFIAPEAAMASAEDAVSSDQARLYHAYQQHLLACNSMDFDDLIMLPVQLFREYPEVLNNWQDRVRYLLVDEYQDTNISQYEMVRALCNIRQKLTVVGDDDQSIYAWRGARPENLQRLQQDFPSLEVIKLEQNYRSTSRILGAANQLIANNPHLYDKQLWSASGAGDLIRVFPCKNADDEASQVVVDILSKRFQENIPCSHFAILYRSNFQSRNYEKALRDHSIPYQVAGGNAFFERREIKDIMAYLRLLTNPDDDQALLRIINVPRREIGTTSIRNLADYANTRKRSLDIAIRELGMLESLNRRARIRIQEFTELITELRHQVEHDDAMSLCRTLLARIDYPAWLQETCTSAKQAEAALENVMELVSWIGNLQKDREDPSLHGVISHLSLMSILENSEDQKPQDAVQLMTIHAAKGLEFDHVYLVGFEEDSLPHHQSQNNDGIEEERRLAYVGITRAAVSLTLSYAKTRQKFGALQHCEASRFLYELPEADLEGAEHTASKLSESEKHQRGLDTFADLKALLGTTD